MPWPFWSKDDCTDDDERVYISTNCKEGVDPRSTWEDWGEHDVDHEVETRDDVHASTEDEIETYYNENRPSGWWPL
ncbi:MAG: hypothetical protein WBA99_18230 [Nodosilinea sp.]